VLLAVALVVARTPTALRSSAAIAIAPAAFFVLFIAEPVAIAAVVVFVVVVVIVVVAIVVVVFNVDCGSTEHLINRGGKN